jgi:Fe-S-cluster-containing dehydrogenase component/formate-dependent nitrite reductase membrane component NrfD
MNLTAATPEHTPVPASAARPGKWAKVIDHTRCVGCHACTVACKSENEVPLSVTRTYVKYVDVGTFPQTRRAFQVTRCNQCDDAPCVEACPTSAMYRRPDGIVDFDKSICIGCKACIAACPYDAIFINPEDLSAEKCNFCAHRLDVGLEPACVVVCPTEAILIGDLNDPTSKVSQIVHREPVTIRRPEKETHPKLFYRGAHQATLDPIAAQRPPAGLFMWSEQGSLPHHVTSGHPDGWSNSSAAAILSYDVPHASPWHWKVSLYTWTKGIAAGAYIVPLLLLLAGILSGLSPLWIWAAPVVAGVFLAATGTLLVTDLTHPERFYLIFTRPQWRSWLVRGAFIISAYGLVLVLHFVASLLDWGGLRLGVEGPGLPLAVLTAVYTAYLFAQARARDLWQNPLLPPHLLLQSLLAGGAALVPLARWVDPGAVRPLLWVVAGASLGHLLLVLGETTLGHVTAHARLAVREMLAGRSKAYFWAGVALGFAGMVVAWVSAEVSARPIPGAGLAAALLALAGLLLYEHAYVQAGQAVPLA